VLDRAFYIPIPIQNVSKAQFSGMGICLSLRRTLLRKGYTGLSFFLTF